MDPVEEQQLSLLSHTKEESTKRPISQSSCEAFPIALTVNFSQLHYSEMIHRFVFTSLMSKLVVRQEVHYLLQYQEA